MNNAYRFLAMDAERLEDIENRLFLEYGEKVTINWDTVERDADGTRHKVSHSEEYYIGRLEPGQSGKLFPILASLLIDGMNLQAAFNRRDLLVFFELLDEQVVNLIFSILLGEKPQWVKAHFDILWAVDVLAAFWAHNDFLALAERVKRTAERMNLNADAAKTAILNKP